MQRVGQRDRALGVLCLGTDEPELAADALESLYDLQSARGRGRRPPSGARAAPHAAGRGRAPGRTARGNRPREMPSQHTSRLLGPVRPRFTLYEGTETVTSFETFRGMISSRTARSECVSKNRVDGLDHPSGTGRRPAAFRSL